MKNKYNKLGQHQGKLPEIYTVHHGVTLKNKLFRILIFVKIFFKAIFYPTS